MSQSQCRSATIRRVGAPERRRLAGFPRVAALVLPLAGLLLPLTPANALGPKSQVALAQLRYRGGNPLPRPSALRRLAWEIDKRTSIDVAADPVLISLADKRLFSYPFLYLSGDGGFPLPPEAEIKRLRRYLIYGGTLLVDSAEARPGGAFDRSVRQLVAAALPDGRLQRVPAEHTLHKSFYLLERALGRVDLVPYLEGIERDERMVVIYTQNDLGGAWARDSFGQWEFSVYPGGARQRERAFRWGVNVLMYTLCVDYKADQVHIPFILKRRRWRVAP